MPMLTMGLTEVKGSFSKVTAEVNRTGRPVTALKNNRPRVLIQPVDASMGDAAVDVAVDCMDEYADVFREPRSLRELPASRVGGVMLSASLSRSSSGMVLWGVSPPSLTLFLTSIGARVHDY